MSEMFSAKTSYAVADLPQNKAVTFEILPSDQELDLLAKELDLVELRKLRFQGKISARGKRDWSVKGLLGATVTQSCVATLAPVKTRLDFEVDRLFVANFAAPTEEEYEVTDDDGIDPLGDLIDLGEILIEDLALNLPLYPRAKDAVPEETVFTEPGKTPMRDEDTRPFAGLAGLRDQLSKNDEK